ncbi:MAG: flagellar biosynthesis anti-sigma factor FlgM [Leptospirales bacterium]|nr:flagellar biosynthesis anti-sigma factor FlgM [Leptospirales bacterium]
MIIDKVGGVGPNYGPKKNEPTARAETPLRAGDAVTISAEGARAAEAARVAKAALQTEEPDRAERLRDIKERVARGEYDAVSDEQANRVAESLLGVFFRG